MAIITTFVSPNDASTNNSVSTEIVINIQDTVDSLNLTTVDIDVDDGSLTNVIISGVFANNWTGEIINNNPGPDDEYTFVLIRPTSDPLYPEDQEVNVDISAEATPNSFSFSTESKSVISPTYTEELDLSGPGVPSGWTAFSSGTGSNPTFSGSMTTDPGASGKSYIYKASYGLDFVNGILIDFTISNSSINMGSGSDSLKSILELNLGGSGEIFLQINDGSDPVIKFKNSDTGIPLLFNESLEVRIRVSVKQVENKFLARLYIGYDNTNNRTITSFVLQQTIEVLYVGGILDIITIGSIDDTSFDLTFSKINIKNGSDPDIYYATTISEAISISESTVDGGDKLLIHGLNLAADIITPTLNDDTWISDLSQGTGSSILVSNNELDLIIDGATASANDRAIAKFAIPLSSDTIGGIDLKFNIEVDQTLISILPGFDVIIFGLELKIGNKEFVLELLSNIVNLNALFKIYEKTGSDIVTNTAGTTIFNQDLISITTKDHIIRLVNVGNNITLFINNQYQLSLGFSDDSAILALYTKTAQAQSVSTKISNFIIKPLVLFGDKFVDNYISIDETLLNIVTPENPNIGDQQLELRGPRINADLGVFTYTQRPQTFQVGGKDQNSLYVVDPIIKEPLD
jgi:hypothetical protein